MMECLLCSLDQSKMEPPCSVGIPAAEIRRELRLQILSHCDNAGKKMRHSFL